MSNFSQSNVLGTKMGTVLQMCFTKLEMISGCLRARDSMWGHKKCPVFNTAVSLLHSKACQLCSAERMNEGRGHSKLTLKM